MSQLFKGTSLVLKDGSKVKAEEHLKGKITVIYFSAGWCPPCRNFTPKLKKFYEELKQAGKNIEVVFVSRDRSAQDLVEYYDHHHGAWTYLEFGNPLIQELLTKFEIKTIPSLKVVKPDGTVVVNDARTEVVEKGEKASDLFEEWKTFHDA